MNKYAGMQVQQPRDPREGLEAVVALRRLVEMLEASQVENAYVAGWSWAQIAEVLGVSRQAVHKKHARRLKAKFSGGSREGKEDP
jgi:hypothetical protein